LCEIAGVPARINFFTNGTSDGEYMIDTGLKNSENFGKVYMWNGRNTTPEGWWYSPEAREINGTDGELYPPGLWNHQRLNLFNGMLGRSVYIQFETESVFENIPVYQYNFPIELYNWSLPENKGFCDPKTPQYFNESIQPVGCLPSGILDLSSTQPAHARIYLSGSHFYRCSNALYENFIGFRSPDSNVDRTFFEMEPMTGTVINVKQTSQVNLGILSGDLG
uniref:Glycoprotein n=1 Tax=Dracunculus medinensis TaxID=318479 RepID=A0A158Q454_DRAME